MEFIYTILLLFSTVVLTYSFTYMTTGVCSFRDITGTSEKLVPFYEMVTVTYKAKCKKYWMETDCVKTKTESVLKFKTVTFMTRTMQSVCCSGYEKENDKCVSTCEKTCQFGKCLGTPPACRCSYGFVFMDNFTRSCKPPCSTYCKNGMCNMENSICKCYPGYFGNSCEEYSIVLDDLHPFMKSTDEPTTITIVEITTESSEATSPDTSTPCSNFCQNGACLTNGTCECYYGYAGEDCSVEKYMNGLDSTTDMKYSYYFENSASSNRNLFPLLIFIQTILFSVLY